MVTSGDVNQYFKQCFKGPTSHSQKKIDTLYFLFTHSYSFKFYIL